MREVSLGAIALVAAGLGCAEITGIEPAELFDCQPGEIAVCYSGPEGTLDVGPCRAGKSTCTAEGTGFGPCEGEVVPKGDECSGKKDQPCSTDDDCIDDTYCGEGDKCLPWTGKTPPEDDPTCVVLAGGAPSAALSPVLACEFIEAPAGDPFPEHMNVQSTPVVADFHGAGARVPSIVATFGPPVENGSYVDYEGVIRVLRGKDCALEAILGGEDLDGDGATDWLVSTSTPAIGDLDGDGVPEIVAHGADGSTLAWKRSGEQWSLFWKSKLVPGQLATPCSALDCRYDAGGPSIHDLDGDGLPEVVREGAVIDGKTGAVIVASAPGYAFGAPGYFQLLGLAPVVADLDGDGKADLTNGVSLWSWGGSPGAWQTGASLAPPDPGAGLTAIADLGAYGTGIPAERPEIVVVRDSSVAVYAMTGEVVMPPTRIVEPWNTTPRLDGGGTPVIADFDGDGLPEIGVATKTSDTTTATGSAFYASFYTVFDLDCGPNPRPGGACALGPCDHLQATCPAGGYVLWSRLAHDAGLSIATGSAAFDFDGDGRSEVVYADQCFARAYGAGGDVLMSIYRSSGTWIETPVVADVDGDARADLVVSSNLPSFSICDLEHTDGLDVSFAGVPCATGADCASGSCVSGLCRCKADAECCPANDGAACVEAGFACAAPPPGTPGAGDTCRAARPHAWSGIRVYSGLGGRWSLTRPIWNQLVYSVTNVADDGSIPATGAWKQAFSEPDLNGWRSQIAYGGSDLTAGGTHEFTCTGAGAVLFAPVCNRGAVWLPPGIHAGFYAGGEPVCGAVTVGPLAPGSCEVVSCTWATPPGEGQQPVDVVVLPNDDHALAECKSGNNRGTVYGVLCDGT